MCWEKYKKIYKAVVFRIDWKQALSKLVQTGSFFKPPKQVEKFMFKAFCIVFFFSSLNFLFISKLFLMRQRRTPEGYFSSTQLYFDREYPQQTAIILLPLTHLN